jgi:hypothetical protein
MEIIRRNEDSESEASVGCSLDLNLSTVCTIVNENKIEQRVRNAGNISSKIAFKGEVWG